MFCKGSIYSRLCTFILMMLFVPQFSYAAESIDMILSQHMVQEPIKMAYQETRYMKLIDEPVKLSGYMYVSTTHFIMEQKHMHRHILVTNHANMWLYNSENKVKQSRNIRRFSNDDTALGALALAMRRGDSSILKDYYKLTLSEDNHVWLLELTLIKDNDDNSFFRITLQGKEGQRAEVMEIDYTNGNHTSWNMQKANSITDVTQEMKSLIKEAGGR